MIGWVFITSYVFKDEEVCKADLSSKADALWKIS